MWPVSDRFLTVLRSPHRVVTRITYETPDGVGGELAAEGGSVSVDGAARIRRTASLTARGNSALFEQITLPGTTFTVMHGVYDGGDVTIPVFTGEVSDATQLLGADSIALTLADHGQWLARARFLTPFAPAPYVTRVNAIKMAVQSAKPDVTFVVTATDAAAIGSGQVWTGSVLDCVSGLATDGGMEAFFQPDGTFLIRDQPSTRDGAVWSPSGLLKSVARKRPLDRLYNTVVVRPTATDGTQPWGQQIAQLTDPTHPRHPSKIGVVPYVWDSPTIQSAVGAMVVARRILDRVQGTTETLQLDAVTNPAFEGGDVLRVITPATGTDPARIFQHFIDGGRLDLLSGGMSLSTRSQVATDA